MTSIPKFDRFVTPENWFPTATGAVLIRPEAPYNGVVVQCFPGGGGSYSTAVSIMCRDKELLPILHEEARKIVEARR